MTDFVETDFARFFLGENGAEFAVSRTTSCMPLTRVSTQQQQQLATGQVTTATTRMTCTPTGARCCCTANRSAVTPSVEIVTLPPRKITAQSNCAEASPHIAREISSTASSSRRCRLLAQISRMPQQRRPFWMLINSSCRRHYYYKTGIKAWITSGIQ